jgi:hypothetical protein
MAADLVGGEGFAVDASVIEANASRFQRVAGSEIDWTEEQLGQRAIKEFIAALESENSPVNPDQPPKAMSPTDPSAAWTTRRRHKVMFGYSLSRSILLSADSTALFGVDVQSKDTARTQAAKIIWTTESDLLCSEPTASAFSKLYPPQKS